MKRYRRPPDFPARPIYLRAWRKHCKVTLVQIQTRTGMSKGALSRIERGLSPYYGDILEAYAHILGVEINQLFTAPDPARQEIDTMVAALSPRQRRRALGAAAGGVFARGWRDRVAGQRRRG